MSAANRALFRSSSVLSQASQNMPAYRFDALTTACILDSQLHDLEKKTQDMRAICEAKRVKVKELEMELERLKTREAYEKNITGELEDTLAHLLNSRGKDETPLRCNSLHRVGPARDSIDSLSSLYSCDVNEETSICDPMDTIVNLDAGTAEAEGTVTVEPSDAAQEPSDITQGFISPSGQTELLRTSLMADIPIAKAFIAITQSARRLTSMYEPAAANEHQPDRLYSTSPRVTRKTSRKQARNKKGKRPVSFIGSAKSHNAPLTDSTVLNNGVAQPLKSTMSKATMLAGTWKRSIITRSQSQARQSQGISETLF